MPNPFAVAQNFSTSCSVSVVRFPAQSNASFRNYQSIDTVFQE